ncbi:MAG TPA: hypothetical protein VF101_05035 [Gaiellaceae bacterium]
MKKGIVLLFAVLLLALATVGAGWKWTHHGPPPGTPTGAADESSVPDGWSWDA